MVTMRAASVVATCAATVELPRGARSHLAIPDIPRKPDISKQALGLLESFFAEVIGHGLDAFRIQHFWEEIWVTVCTQKPVMSSATAVSPVAVSCGLLDKAPQRDQSSARALYSLLVFGNRQAHVACRSVRS